MNRTMSSCAGYVEVSTKKLIHLDLKLLLTPIRVRADFFQVIYTEATDIRNRMENFGLDLPGLQ
jgi:hypothetical protein